MKFGKRLESEAERRWLEHYIDYKALKKSIKRDVELEDPNSAEFRRVLQFELNKVSSFYFSQESAVERHMESCVADGMIPEGCLKDSKVASESSVVDAWKNEFLGLKKEIHDLNKFVMLNYIAVVKAVKKRNRHMKAACPQGMSSMRAGQILVGQYFCSSLKLAAMSTRVEIVSHKVGMDSELLGNSVEEEYACPICLNMLNNPVVLSCAHRYCWGCIVSLCSSVKRDLANGHTEDFDHNGKGDQLMVESALSTSPDSTVLRTAVWESDLSDDENSTVATFQCPCCRKQELLNLERLHVDQHLSDYIETLGKKVDAMELDSKLEDKSAIAIGTRQYLLPPQKPEDEGKLVVCLDLDGTLVTTFTPKRAPTLPPSSISYIVGQGGKLNPGGVFVVERPGLESFLKKLSKTTEVVLFTAGLEDYAAPICNEIERRYGKVFAHRLYRPATVHSDVYPCLKDLSRLGRDINKCILVDDTPLAFFRQPDNGVPVLQFRGDVDDRLLPEAVEPLIVSLAREKDVMIPLRRRFNMRRWFAAQGLDPTAEMAAAKAAATATMNRSQSSNFELNRIKIKETVRPTEILLISDFDKSITDWDAGERLTDELAPELTSLLSSLESPANFIPLMNTVLSEMHRRGVSRDRMINVLRGMGAEVPRGSINMLRWAAGRGIDVRVFSDCNSVFIHHILSSAKVISCVREVVTNPAAFERVEDVPVFQEEESKDSSWFFGDITPPEKLGPQQRLLIKPRHDYNVKGSHGCPLCPANLCKGKEIDMLKAAKQGRVGRIIFIGDGGNDYCPALCLGPDDYVLVRSGFTLERLIKEKKHGRHMVANVLYWSKHDELPELVKKIVSNDITRE